MLASLRTLLAVLCVAVCAAPVRTTVAAEILWDNWRVPHIFAESEPSAAYGLGWAQMESRGALMIHLFGEARGRASEYWGAGSNDERLSSDRWTITMDVPERAHEWYEQSNARVQAYVAAFVAGINDYAARHDGDFGPELRQVLPIRPEDIVAHMMLTLQFDFLANPAAVRQKISNWRQRQEVGPANRPVQTAEPPAQSVGWAIAPSRSATGHAILMINPHLPWHGRTTLYEAHLVADHLDFYGATLIGFPVLAMGFNDHLGWTHTVNTVDGADLYELSLVDGGYRWDGTVAPLRSKHHSIQVRDADGQLHEKQFDVLYSKHGPIVAQVGEKALALRVACLDCSSVVEQYLDMMEADSKDQFLAAIRRLQVPIFTVLYADRGGHILMLFGGRTPARPFGDWAYWQDIVPGDTSSTLWTRELAFDQLPLLQDPPSGWLQNANEPPWTATLPVQLHPAAFPPYLAPQLMTPRARASIRVLANGSRFTFDDVVQNKFSTAVELAGRVVDDLVGAAKASGNAKAAQAASILERWDRHVDAESRGAVLFEHWVMQMGGEPKTAIPWILGDPIATPAQLADRDRAVAALIVASDRVAALYGAPDVAWGDVHRLSRGATDIPAAGASDPLGVLRNLSFAPARNGRRIATGGDSFVSVIEFAEDGPRAMALLTYGNSARAGGSSQPEQLALYASGKLRPVWKRRSDIEANLDHRTLAVHASN